MGRLLDETDEQLKFQCIDVEKANFPIDFMCKQLKVSRSGYYAWRSRGPSVREQQDRELGELVREEFGKHKRGCGSRMLVAALRRIGRPCSRKRVVRLMHVHGLRHRLKCRYRRPSAAKQQVPVVENVLDRRFEPGAPNKVWAADITQLWTKTGWAYMAVVLDVGIRRVIGWNVSKAVDTQLVVGALNMAVHERRPPHGVIHHSDRGVQYASHEYQTLLGRHAFVPSMSRKGNCWDNAVVESFFSAMKRELPKDGVHHDALEVEHEVFKYIVTYYNLIRPHSTLHYLTPTEYELRHAG